MHLKVISIIRVPINANPVPNHVTASIPQLTASHVFLGTTSLKATEPVSAAPLSYPTASSALIQPVLAVSISISLRIIHVNYVRSI